MYKNCELKSDKIYKTKKTYACLLIVYWFASNYYTTVTSVHFSRLNEKEPKEVYE